MKPYTIIIPALLMQACSAIAQIPAPTAAPLPAPLSTPAVTPAPAASSATPTLKDLSEHLNAAKEIHFDVIGTGIGSSKTVEISGVLASPNKMAVTIGPSGKPTFEIFSDGTKSWAYSEKTNTYTDLGTPDTHGDIILAHALGFIMSQSSPDDPSPAMMGTLTEITIGSLTQIDALQSAMGRAASGQKWVHSEQTAGGQTIEEDLLTIPNPSDENMVENISFSYTNNPWSLKSFIMAVGPKDKPAKAAINISYNKCDLISSDGPLTDPKEFAFIPPASSKVYVPAPEAQPTTTALQPGVRAPNFSVITPTGQHVKLSDYTGKVVVMDLWATWCGPCQMSLPHTDKIAQRYLSKGVVFLPVCVWDTKDSFTKWLPDHKSMKMRFLFDTGSQSTSFATTRYKVDGIPTQFVIGRNGEIAATLVGYDSDDPNEKELTAAIDKALAHK
jgi:thiol-disulfide isomerase/thioredoxin